MEKVYYNEKYLPKVEKGNPWIHRGELIGDIHHIEPGSLVEVFTPKGDFVGRGYINPHLAIAVRLFTRRHDEEIEKDFFRKRIEQANNLRMRIYPHLTADYCSAFAAAGLRVVNCFEPRLTAEAAMTPTRDRLPEATLAAYVGLPGVIIWQLEKA